MKVWIVANPKSGRKGGLRVNQATPDEARAVLARHGVEAELHLTERRGHATTLAHQAAAAGVDVVVAAGGDGTIHEVAYGLIGTDTKMAILPLGSFVNLGRALNVPRDLDRAAEIIRDGRVADMEVGRVTTARGDFYFLEAAGVGFDAGLFAYANQLDAGKWRYLWPMLRFLTRYRPHTLEMSIDGRTELLRHSLMVTVAVAPFIGTNLAIAPDAKIDDHRFDVLVRSAPGRLDVVPHAAAILLGQGLHRRLTSTGHGRDIEITHRDRQALVHADGEIVGSTPVSFALIPHALRVVVGSEPIDGVSGVHGVDARESLAA